ncbi:hypothetical protein F511_19373 [Dorcoceras hygrometricum]|uniref:Dystroglycan-like n=1 Tax=Dorcoceras hygrometricum TaxID=472368 RepID=A0A2Z7B769_9LAMI|nr:hypothetical protein F511_19373 [Dorcoceras hygrometricum]
MSSSLIANVLQVNFDSVPTFPEEGMVKMFKSLESIGLRGFLGCPSVLYEQDLEHFFSAALVRKNEVISAVQGKFVGISEEQFSDAFGLQIAGLTDITEVPKDLVYDARSIFSASGELVKTSCKKREMKFEFRLLNDILAKSIIVKAGSFDVVTHERFLLMTAIHFGMKINWSKILFDILKEMVTKSSNKAKGFAAQICVLLKGTPNLTLGEAKTFPPLKILTVKTVGTSVSKNKNITADEDEPVEKVIREKVIEEIVSFFYSFSLCCLAILESFLDIAAKKEHILAWAETDSLQTAMSRRLYIIAKSSSPCVSKLVEQMRQHQLEWTQPCSSKMFEGANVQRGAVIARSHPSIKYICWIRRLILLNGAWTVIERADKWVHIVAVGPVVDRSTVLKRILNDVQHRIQVEGFCDFFVHHADQSISSYSSSESVESIKMPKPEEIPANPRSSSSSSDSRMLFTADDLPDISPIDDELDDMRKEVHDQKAAIVNDLLEFRVEAQENFQTLSANLSEIISYINRGRDDIKGEISSSRGPQPPNDQSRPGSGGGSRSEPPRKRGGGSNRGGGNTSSSGFRYWFGE